MKTFEEYLEEKDNVDLSKVKKIILLLKKSKIDRADINKPGYVDKFASDQKISLTKDEVQYISNNF